MKIVKHLTNTHTYTHTNVDIKEIFPVCDAKMKQGLKQSSAKVFLRVQ